MKPKRWGRGRRGSTDHATIGGEIAVEVGRRGGRGDMMMMRGVRDDTDIDDQGRVRGHEMTRGNLVDTGTDRARHLETGGAEKTVESESMMASTSSETEAVRDTETGDDGMARKVGGGVLRGREWERGRGIGIGIGRGRGRGSAVHHHTPDGGGTIRGEMPSFH